MLYLVIKALVSGLIVAAASEVARRQPGWGGLIVSLPMVSLLSFVWLWRETGDPEQIARLAVGSFWFFLPSMPLFLVLPLLLRSGTGFWLALGIVCAMTVGLYAAMAWVGPRFGLQL